MKISKIIGFVTIQGLIASLLLYKADVGLNFLLLSIWLAFILALSNKLKKQSYSFIAIAVALAISLFYTPQILPVILLILIYILFIGTSGKWLKNSLFQTIEGFIHSGGWVSIIKMKLKIETASFDIKKILPFIIPIPFILLFLILYKIGNPVFDYFTDQLSFDINLGFIFAFMLACFYSFPLFIENDRTWINYPKSKIITTKPNDLEYSVFKITLLSLSILLGVFHLLDFAAIIEPTILDGHSYSQLVHQGFWTLVISIILSLLMILVLSRNKIDRNSILNKIIILWLGLNLLLVFSTGIKNMMYVMEYGLTYKRIAVIFALMLSAIYIIISFLKVYKNIDFVTLSGIMYKTTLLFTCFFSIVPWNQTITIFNLSELSQQHDIDYLVHLENNEIELYNAFKTGDISMDYNQREAIKIEYTTKHQEHMDNHWYEKNLYWILNSEKISK